MKQIIQENKRDITTMATLIIDQEPSILTPISIKTGLPLDQVKFVTALIGSVLLGYPYRVVLSATKCSEKTRKLAQIIPGFALAYFCYGHQVGHLLVQNLVCLVIMRNMKGQSMAKTVLFFAMAHLAGNHVYRLMFNYLGYTRDINGPLMINTQRLTGLAFSLADGQAEDESKLSSNRKRLATKSVPDLLSFLAYVFSFHTIIIGPYCHYKDFEVFIGGQNPQPQGKLTWLTIKHFLISLIFGLILVFVQPKVPIRFALGEEFSRYGILRKWLYMISATAIDRTKYFFAWEMAEAASTNAGLAFNGYKNNGELRWDLMKNVNYIRFKFARSLKEVVDNWHITTTSWLRYIVFERMQSQTNGTVLTLLVSTIWHGFYPGYYICFATFSLCVLTARVIRRQIRHVFQEKYILSCFYDLLTFMTTKVALAYAMYPFFLLEFWPSVHLFSSMNWILHVLAILTLMILGSPGKRKQNKIEKVE